MKLNIMLVDDNKIDLFVNKKIIENAQIDSNVRTFVRAQSALSFLKIFEKNKEYKTMCIPDIIFLDINMPEMNGFQFLDEFNKLENIRDKNIKIYLLSSSTNIHDVIKAKSKRSCVGFISKPLTANNLNRVLRESRPYLIKQNHQNRNTKVMT